MMSSAAQPVRTVLISDVHLGSKHTQASKCLQFLKACQPEQLYLVGDFIDGWRCNHGWHWTEDCTAVMDRIEELMQAGTRVYYTPGNHDAFLRDDRGIDHILERFAGKFGRVNLANEFVFETLRGWRFLVSHGDLFDVVERQAQWISKASSFGYDSILNLNRNTNRVIGRGHRNPYGVCAKLKSSVKSVVRMLSDYETKMLEHAQSRLCDGAICGHIHTPTIVNSQDALYCNTGDWVENCTGLIEHLDGMIELRAVYGKSRYLDLPARTSLSERFNSEAVAATVQTQMLQATT
ncbi:UDP-2,3-diacylglucosamine pyrophosphatase LpxH [Neorhodopirellula lusitana]|uniref:UDP-2,3-diacylglucosamine pyrophosphatase LpxH n=1 Tax=Neorhodopirellula lusitana TaxID=445327 RepID=A0ABY1PP08_9BACT|nr:UDP-2,3-diacylglucosamine diphosphatase [Neorhodopirellula lusitana]SMP39970.1 UDP-2,3-diacylglucosamine pyrophosphatase LpxH [Neorhodopirellula lusitana]